MCPKQFFVSFLILLFISQLTISQRKVTELDSGWKFFKGNQDQAYQTAFDDSAWQSVSVPHDWAIEGPFIREGDGNTGKLPWKGEGWYRKKLSLSDQDKGKRIYLLFDGVMAFPKVYVNGKLAGSWDYGYNSFYLDITELIQYRADNILAVHADTRKHDSRWYPGAGIYRKVQLIAVDPVHAELWGTHITTPVIKPHYTEVRVNSSIKNSSSEQKEIVVKHIIYSADKRMLREQRDTVLIPGNSIRMAENTITLPNPLLWDPETANLYLMGTEIYHNNKLLDMTNTTFGVREIRFTADHGLYVNNKRVQLKGVNLHHDLGALGSAFNYRAMQRQLEIMKDMGCNAIRTSHNTPAPELLDLCDEMGLLVIDEVFDKYDGKADITDTTDFEDFAQRNIKNFVTRDRNHPSIFLWSVGNEMGEVQWNKNNGFQKLQTMINLVKQHDNSRPVTMVNDKIESAKMRHFDMYDVHCWNYGRRYSLARQMEPNKAVIITESASTVSTRGFYELPLPEKKTDYTKSLQVSSYDLNAPNWAEIADDDFMWQQEEPYIAGEFVWTGFDYLGEPEPYTNTWAKNNGFTDAQASRSSYFGIVDLSGIPKDRYYLYKSYWKPENTTVHILPHWNWEERTGKNVPVFVYTNGDCAELFLNGNSQGSKCKNPKSDNSTERFRLMWKDVIYQPGELKAIAYKAGKKIGESIVRTADQPYKIRLSPDRNTIKTDGKDLSYILVEALDKNGNLCALAYNSIEVKLSGAGELAGLDNGNPQSMTSFKSSTIDLFYGKAMLIVRSKNTVGNVNVRVISKDLKEAATTLKTE